MAFFFGAILENNWLTTRFLKYYAMWQVRGKTND
jgi:hypothetical protein